GLLRRPERWPEGSEAFRQGSLWCARTPTGTDLSPTAPLPGLPHNRYGFQDSVPQSRHYSANASLLSRSSTWSLIHFSSHHSVGLCCTTERSKPTWSC